MTGPSRGETPTPPRDIPLERAALFLDIDGTLVDIALRPDWVEVPSTLVTTLEKLAVATQGAIAFVTGRPIADADRLFRPLRFAVIGGHGAECRFSPHGEVEYAPPVQESLRRWIGNLAHIAPHILVEDKGTSFAVHYRRAPEAGPVILQAMNEQTPVLAAAGLQVLKGKDVYEIKPRWFNKGTALRKMMARPPFAGRTPYFIGDDITDEDAFRVLPEFAGKGFSVGREFKGATYAFDVPADVRRFLAELSERGKSR